MPRDDHSPFAGAPPDLRTISLAGRIPRTVVESIDSMATLDDTSGRAVQPIGRLGRYIVGDELGRGGMGRVVEAWDPELRRSVAIKVVLDTRAHSPEYVSRFVAEAQITSQLEHPAIVPVHDCGVTSDGQVFYVMKKVGRRSLRAVLGDLCEQRTRGESAEWSLHRLLAAFVRVCEAIAFAHTCGVLHRDLKPENIMLGDFGEVLVLDWGIARLRGAIDEQPRAIEHITLDDTLVGSVIGTPGYMSPEQLRGELSALDERSDVWSLGAILYELLTLRRPYAFTTVASCLAVVSEGPPPDPRERAFWTEVTEEISALAVRCLEPEPERRLASAGILANEVNAFLEGSHRRERALALVREAEPIDREADLMRERAESLRVQAQAQLRGVPGHAGVDAKRAAWALEEEADSLDDRAQQKEVRYRVLLQNALYLSPDLYQPHRLLAAHYRELHLAAELEGRRREAESYEALLRLHDRGEHGGYLAGRGAVTLVTDPPGAEVELLRYEVADRRLAPRSLGVLGRTPLRAVELPMGRYLLVCRREGHADVRYPLRVRRDGHEDGVAPGETEPWPIRLPRQGEVAADEAYVPAGWFEAGGDAQAPRSFPRRRLWLDGFCVRRHPICNAEYIAFLDALVGAGREDEALACAPRQRPGAHGEEGAMIYGRDATGLFELRPDADGDVWHPRWPVIFVDWYCAARFAAWQSERTGLGWRLPFELEWEKAARGVDGRIFPWGDFLDPSWLCMGDSHASRPTPEPIEARPGDESPYGVFGLAGNVADWCADAASEGVPEDRPRLVAWDGADPTVHCAVRGGTWYYPALTCRSARRAFNTPANRDSYLGFRLVRPFV